MKTVEQEKLELEKKWKEYERLIAGSSDILRLDVGGTHKITVSKSILTSVEDSFMSKYFNIKSNFFLDCANIKLINVS